MDVDNRLVTPTSLEKWSWGGAVAFQSSVCATAIYVWDLLSTIPHARRFIWRTPFPRENFLYIWCRYYGLAGLLIYLFLPREVEGPADCLRRHSVRYALAQLSMAITQLWTLKQTLLFLCNRSKKTTLFILSSVVISALCQSTGVILYFRQLVYASDCQRAEDGTSGVVLFTLASMILQCIILAVSLVKWLETVKNQSSSLAKITNVTARDNTVVSFIMLSFFISAFSVGRKYRHYREDIWDYCWAWYFVFLNMAPYRMILNLREAQLTARRTSSTFSAPLELTEINTTLSWITDVSR
ncbi:hypothetical protein VKT23_006615 [Stygiomarasmius scandens]|uniref:DUF6533 domain-containing protein n=1 Tax=Marasmiellus scandens TaxID=2682957 RepID=A0ABR1JSN7_9AGAR